MRNKIIITLAVLFALTITAGCAFVVAPMVFAVFFAEVAHPRHVESLARDPKVQAALVAWVDANVTDDLKEGDSLVRLPTIPRPGDFEIRREFDSLAAGLGSKSWHASLVCDASGERVSVYFGDGTRQGILVSLHGKWGLEGYGRLTVVSDRVAFHDLNSG
jgi:hypothetical protein